MGRTINRLAIVNRGEPATRCIHAAREYAAERGRPIRTVALFTEPERQALFVREADEAVGIGPALFVDPADGQRKVGYLDYPALERALVASEADAVWVGWGFVAEHPAFVEMCERLGLTFVGPPSQVMRRLGDKITSKELAEQAGVPVAPWSNGPVETLTDALAHGERIGTPLMIKATAGGGGRGIRLVRSLDDLASAFETARAEAHKAFGDPTVFLEQAVAGARHIEVQVIADTYGNAWSVGVRDCTIQRRNQKVVEESASTALSSEQHDEIGRAAAQLARTSGYQNAGTVEFLYQPEEQRFSFMEVNARLQVEHPVTEATTGADLVKLQFHVAEGGRLEGEPPPPQGHAIEVRLNAEDPEHGFAPAPGTISLLRLPTGPGVRVDTGVAEGDSIPPEFDSMIAKIIAWGRDREEARVRLRRALGETSVVIDGGTTNKGFLLDLLDRAEVKAGEYDNSWLDRLAAAGEITTDRHAALALLVAAIDAYEAERTLRQGRFFASAFRGRPEADATVGATVELRHRQNTYRLTVARIGPVQYRISVDEQVLDLTVQRVGRFQSRVTTAAGEARVVSVIQGIDHLVEIDGLPHRVSRDDGGIVRSPARGVVVSITVEPGELVEAGQTVAVLEAMKMELPVTAPGGGRVRAVLAGANLQIDAGAALVQLEPADVGEAGPTTDRVSFVAHVAESATDLDRRCATNTDRLEWLLLGYDVEPVVARELSRDQADVCHRLPVDDARVVEGEARLLATYADMRALFRAHREAEDDEELTRSAEEHLFAYLRSLDAEGEGLPDRFLERLKRALSHYGVTDLERGPALEEALHWIFLSRQRVASQTPAITSILNRWLERGHEVVLDQTDRDQVRSTLDRLVAATERTHPVVADLARETRFSLLDEPVLARIRADHYADAEGHFAALLDADGADRAEHLDALVSCPLPLAPRLLARMPEAGDAVRQAALGVMVRRYYRVPWEDTAESSHDGRPVLTTRYEDDGSAVRLIAVAAPLADLAGAVATATDVARTAADGDRVAFDLYTWSADPVEPDRVAELAAVLGDLPTDRPIAHAVVVVTGAGPADSFTGLRHYTFHPGEDGFREDEAIRGLHPRMARRLHLWRFANFSVLRQPSAEDVYLFRGVALDNPGDERLFAVGEVRDLTPVRDHAGVATALPQLERILAEAIQAMRRFQALRPPGQRLQWNRVRLHIWPVLDLSLGEIYAIARRVAPTTVGIGLEEIALQCRRPDPQTGEVRWRVLRMSNPTGLGFVVTESDPPDEPLAPLDEYTQKVVQARRRGTTYPYELLKLLIAPRAGGRSDVRGGEFAEHDLEGDRLVPVSREPGHNTAGLVTGVVRTVTDRYPEGITRVALLGDPTKSLGSLAEAECRRIIAAIDLAEEIGVPLEWFALSAGARIAMDSGTENMDWIAAVLRRLIEFTQVGGEVNVVVAGINVGAQPYWNAEATMLMHTKGILVMTPDSAMVLTGKQALDYSGGVSAEDNFGIGGYERIMGPNGQGQYWAPSLEEACGVLLAHYDHAYAAPGERFPRPGTTTDARDRDVRPFPHRIEGLSLTTVGEIMSEEANPGRKQPFDIRTVMRAVSDQDHQPLERWRDLRDGDSTVVWDAYLGGHPICLLGIEGRPLPRRGLLPADGPDQWTSGTLFPVSAKKLARAINGASGNRPVVVMANLSGFDGSPDSMRALQLEFGAEIGRAVVNFDGPIVFCVVSRYHGGAFVVFSQRLNESMETVAVEGAQASVIGGAPAAAVVFAAEVRRRTENDPRVAGLQAAVNAADAADRASLQAELDEVTAEVHAEQMGQLADEFDRVHSVERAQRVGSVNRIIPAAELRPQLIDAVERGIERTLDILRSGC